MNDQERSAIEEEEALQERRRRFEVECREAEARIAAKAAKEEAELVAKLAKLRKLRERHAGQTNGASAARPSTDAAPVDESEPRRIRYPRLPPDSTNPQVIVAVLQLAPTGMSFAELYAAVRRYKPNTSAQTLHGQLARLRNDKVEYLGGRPNTRYRLMPNTCDERIPGVDDDEE